MSRIMLVHAAARMSIFDVSNGIAHGLRDIGTDFAEYGLFRRIEIAGAGIKAFCPDGQEPDSEQICLLASEPLPYRVITEGCRWVFIVSSIGLHPNALVALKRMGVKIACWFTEAPYNSKDDEELYMAKLCDIAFVNERTSLDMFREIVPQVYYLPHSFNPTVHKLAIPNDLSPELESDCIFIGTGWKERQMLFEHINFDEINFVLGGSWDWIMEPSHLAKYKKYPIVDNAFATKLYHNTKIAINPHRYSATAESANPRTFELAACGVFQISDYRKEIEDIFGDAIPMYDPQVPWQLESKIRHYLNHESERIELAKLAQARVQEYTFSNRARDITTALENF